jgi:hypothetical protein
MQQFSEVFVMADLQVDFVTQDALLHDECG